MKRFCFLILILSACVSSTRESETHIDSVASGYEDFSEVGPFTVKDDIRNQPVTLNGKRKALLDYLVLFYYPDTYTPHTPDDSVNTPQYIITEATVIENTFFRAENESCEKRSILMAGRGDFVEKEYYDLLIVNEDSSGKFRLADKITFDGSEGQSSTLVSASSEALSTREECNVLKITSTTEGGDINLRKREWVEYYVADEKSFRPVLKIETEKTDIQDYEATQDENQNSSSELREIKVLETASRGLYDIEVRYTNIQNGVTSSESTEIFSFNGVEYVTK